MQPKSILTRDWSWSSLLCAMIFLCASPLAVAAEELPDYLIQKGGVIYPVTGDSTQEIFRTPPNITDILKPGMMIGVLPEDCFPASGPVGDYYQCHHDLVLKPHVFDNRDVYMVIESPR